MQQSQGSVQYFTGIAEVQRVTARGGGGVRTAVALHGLNWKKAIDRMYTSITCLEVTPQTYSRTRAPTENQLPSNPVHGSVANLNLLK